MADNVIGIKFGVAGEGSISGESGRLIKSQLEQIAKAVNLQVKVNINKTHFKSQLTDLKKEIDSTLGGLNINVGTTGGKTGGSGGAGGGGSGEKSAYSSLLSTLNKINSLRKQIDAANKKGSTETVKVLTGQMEELERSYEAKLSAAKENNQVTEDEIAAIQRHKEYLESLTAARRKDAAAAQAQADAEKRNKQTSTKKNAWDGLYANAQRLLQREDYLIQNNKKAAASARELEAAMQAGFDDSTPEAAATSVERLRAALKQTDAELAKIGKDADTFGFKIKKAFKTKVVQNLAYALLALVGNAFRQVYQNVKELDKAITDLQIATGYTREETGKLVKEYTAMAKQLGVTTTTVTNAADTWLRQGYEVAEVNKLIKNTLMLSTLGQLDSAEAAKALTSAMKGYNVTVEESINIVDKLTAVDMEAAVSAGDIATAMAETAVSANTAGVSMDRLIGYIATVSEVTQDGAESVGTFYKTMFARMSNIKAGKFVDDETGESLNDVAATLGKVGVSLFDAQGQFRSFETVLDELGSKWEYLDSVQQAAIATAMAGTRQQEKFKVLMENYAKAMDLSGVASGSAGTAQEKYDTAYLDSIEAKLNALKAAWEGFSQSLLDSEFLKLLVDILNGIVTALDFVIGAFDGAISKTALMSAAVILLAKGLDLLIVKLNILSVQSFKKLGVAIASALKKAFTSAGTYVTLIMLLINIFDEIENKNVAGWLMIGTAVAAIVTMIVLAVKGGLKSIDGAVKGFMASNPLGWILAAVTAVVAAITGVFKLIGAARNKGKAEFEEAKKIAEEKKKLADEEIEQAKELNELTREYEELISNKDNFLDLDEEARNRILEIQNKINESVTTEGEYIDLVNGKLGDKLEALKAIRRAEQEQALQAAKDSYLAQKSAQSKSFNEDGWFIPTSQIDNLDGWGYDIHDDYNIVYESGNDGHKYGDEIAAIFSGKSSIKAYERTTFGDKGWNIGFEQWADIGTMAREFKEAIDEARQKYYKNGDDGTRRVIDSLYNYYTENLLPLVENVDEAALQVAQAQLPLLIDEIDIDPSKDMAGFESALIEKMATAMQEYGLSADKIEALVKTFLLSNYYDEYTKGTAGAIKYSFDTILDAVSDGYDALKSAIEDMDELGIVSADTIQDIVENYPELLEYLELTEDGYKVAEGAMDSFLAKMKETYGVGENESTWNAVIATLFASDEIETWIEEQEKIKEAYEGQLNKQKELIDIRKDLLKTYKQELKYQEELAQKQRAVADLRTKLALAKLDTSAAGKARVRELEKELEESENELDDFTLENAIEKITQQMEDGYSEYEKFIQKQIDRIETAINNAAGNYKNGNVVEVPEHHTGGFVGGVELQSHEEFAKLMKGEFVVTPSQMSRFMGETLPTMVGGGTGGEVNYNAPLITIKCDSITKEAVPEVEKIVNEAVNKIKTEIDSAFSRTGFKKKI